MKTTIDWLDAAKQQHDLSDYALAPLLGVTRSLHPSHSGTRTAPLALAFALAT